MEFSVPSPKPSPLSVAVQVAPDGGAFAARIVVRLGPAQLTLLSPPAIIRECEPGDPPGAAAFVERMELKVCGQTRPGVCGGHLVRRGGEAFVLAHDAEALTPLGLAPEEAELIPALLQMLEPFSV